MEEEDFKDKYLKSRAEKQLMDKQSTDINSLEDQLKKLEDQELEEQKKLADEASGKKIYDIKKVLEEKKKQ